VAGEALCERTPQRRRFGPGVGDGDDVRDEPGAPVGIVVRMTSNSVRAGLPPYLRMNASPFSGAPSGPSARFGPWHTAHVES